MAQQLFRKIGQQMLTKVDQQMLTKIGQQMLTKIGQQLLDRLAPTNRCFDLYNRQPFVTPDRFFCVSSGPYITTRAPHIYTSVLCFSMQITYCFSEYLLK